MRQSIIASALIGLGYILHKGNVNRNQYSAEYMAESLVGTGKMKSIVYPLRTQEVKEFYDTLLIPLLKDKDSKKINEINELNMLWRSRAKVREVRDKWLGALVKSAPPKPTSSGKTVDRPHSGSPEYRVWDAWMHNNHSRGRFKTKKDFISVFLINNLGIILIIRVFFSLINHLSGIFNN